MSSNTVLSLHTLPVELVYCILDNLDQLTILLSLRNVCARLNDITDTYHRYQVNFFSHIFVIFFSAEFNIRLNKKNILTFRGILIVAYCLHNHSSEKKRTM